MDNRLVFIQISDIHFQRHSGSTYDEDYSIREGAILDIQTYAKEALGNIDGVMVCGDIAFSAEESQYKRANEFLNEILQIFSLEKSRIFSVPGNHDVNQTGIKQSLYILSAQKKLESIAWEYPEKVEDQIRREMNAYGSEGLLLAPLRNYHEFFADELLCSHSPKEQYWSYEFHIGKYSLVLRGMNSVYISSHLDHKDEEGNVRDDERKMLMNKSQIPGVSKNTVYMSMCHHPPESWIDESLGEMMDERVMLQLYGHKHVQSIDPNEKRVRIYSGALQPEHSGKDEPKPVYNWIVIELKEETLTVKVYPRVYDDRSGRFEAEIESCDEGEIYRICRLKLGNKKKKDLNGSYIEAGNDSPEDGYIMDSVMRDIAYKYLKLSKGKRNELSKKYSDSGVDFSAGKLEEVVNWIRQQGNETEVWNAIKEM